MVKNVKKKRIADRSTHSKKSKHRTGQRSEDIGQRVVTTLNQRDIDELPNVIFPIENIMSEPTGNDSNPFRNDRSSESTMRQPSDGNDLFSNLNEKVPSPSSPRSTLKRKHYWNNEDDSDNDDRVTKKRIMAKDDYNLGGKIKFLCTRRENNFL